MLLKAMVILAILALIRHPLPIYCLEHMAFFLVKRDSASRDEIGRHQTGTYSTATITFSENSALVIKL